MKRRFTQAEVYYLNTLPAVERASMDRITYSRAPPETERKQISKMLSSFDAKIQNAEKCLATLVNLKKALLQQLFI